MLYVLSDSGDLFFFLIQQFITRRAVADRGNYFVTTYRRSKLT